MVICSDGSMQCPSSATTKGKSTLTILENTSGELHVLSFLFDQGRAGWLWGGLISGTGCFVIAGRLSSREKM